jgi:hypothetical protein
LIALQFLLEGFVVLYLGEKFTPKQFGEPSFGSLIALQFLLEGFVIIYLCEKFTPKQFGEPSFGSKTKPFRRSE